MKKLVVFFISTLSSHLHASEIADVFGDGVFGVSWGAAYAEVSAEWPAGKKETYGTVVQYVVEDDKRLFDLPRPTDAITRFGFDSEDRLIGVTVNFDSKVFGDLLSKLNTLFGQHSYDPDNPYLLASWPEDEGIKLSVFSVPKTFGVETVFSIEHIALEKPKVSKDALGF